MNPIRVLIVDDSALIRSMFTEILDSEPDIEVVDTAGDPYIAREKIKLLNPDVLTLDIEMPKMDGLAFLEKIMTLRPMPVIMVSTLTQKGADSTIRALEIGAFDTVAKPTDVQTRHRLAALKDELVAKVRAAASANITHRSGGMQQKGALSFTPPAQSKRQLIAIGSSTGGVEAVRDILLALPENAPPVVIAQHMPPSFTASLAARLDKMCRIRVREARNHDRPQPGNAYIAPGGIHMKVMKLGAEYVCKLEDGPLVSGHKPSVDVLFDSVAQAAGSHGVGIILTGMGRDGANGLKHMRDKGAYTIGQNAATCVVYGMPAAAKENGAVCDEAPLQDIACRALHACEKRENVS